MKKNDTLKRWDKFIITIELPSRCNKKSISLIPKGKYILKVGIAQV